MNSNSHSSTSNEKAKEKPSVKRNHEKERLVIKVIKKKQVEKLYGKGAPTNCLSLVCLCECLFDGLRDRNENNDDKNCDVSKQLTFDS